MSGVTKAAEEKIKEVFKTIIDPNFDFDAAVENFSDETKVDEGSVASGGNGDKEPQVGATNKVDAGEVAAKAAGGDGSAEGPAAGFEASEAAGDATKKLKLVMMMPLLLLLTAMATMLMQKKFEAF
jgi:hypothetical protein